MRVLVTGAGGQLGAELSVALAGHDALLLARADLDVTDADQVEAVLRSATPEAVIHAAALTNVDRCEIEPDEAHRVNVAGTRNVAGLAGDAFLVLVSTDYVFDGTLGRPYTEDDDPHPIQVYGRTKLEAERLALGLPNAAVVRTAWLYGPGGSNFVTAILHAARAGPIDVVDDQVGSPTSCEDLARAIASLVGRPATGVFHVVNEGAVSRFELARAAATAAGLDGELVRPVPTDRMPRPATRPPYAALEGPAWRKAGFDPLPPWDDALARTIAAMR